MRGDFSRLTFDQRNDYRRVLMQQGRVEVDADRNEQADIDAYLSATTNADVIGPAGYPAGTDSDGNPLGGFALAIDLDLKDLTISPGRMYVDGVLVENAEATASLLNQPFVPGATLTDLGLTSSGVYAVYLEVFERLITALDDPHIRETALGGPDTAVRTKLVWRVLLDYIGPVPQDNAQLPSCSSVLDPWRAQATTGTLSASSGGVQEALPCMLPPDTGYGRLENQLYRVEVHEGGADGVATFTWSRENGSVVVLIGPPAGSIGAPPASVTGPTFTVSGLSDDPTLGLQAGDWVELVDDLTEIGAGPGQLYQVAATPTDGRTVELDTASPPTVTLARHPKLRRWDQRGAGLDQGVPLTSGAPIDLEGGLQIALTAGHYRAGDYWLIPARTATSIQQGFIDWPTDASGTPIAKPPAGIAKHHAKLGLVEINAEGIFAGLGTANQPTDCRLPFTPLTGLTPNDLTGPCTIVVAPGVGWELPVIAWFQTHAAGDGTPPPDAEICFPVGDFPLSSVLVIANAGHVRVNGAGWGTHLRATSNGESVVQFENCASVSVYGLRAETTAVNGGQSGGEHINGTLTFVNCDDVSVTDCWLRCGSEITKRGAACVSIVSDSTDANATAGVGSAHVRGCLLHVGEMQVGVQIVHQERTVVEDNKIIIDPKVRATTLGVRLANPTYLAIARSYLVSGVMATAAAAGATPSTQAAGAGRATPSTQAAAAAQTAQAQAVEAPQPAPPPSPPAAEASAKPVEATPFATAAEPATREIAVGADVAMARPASLSRIPLQLQVGNQTVSATVDRGLSTTWQTYLKANAPETFATPRDAANYLTAAANKILTTPSERAGYSAFAGVLRGLQSHVPAMSRGISVGGRGITQLVVSGNSIDGALMGVSVGVSHTATPDEVGRHQRTPDHMVNVHVAGNVIGCYANDIAARVGRFGIFIGNVASTLVENNCVFVTAMGISTPPPADGIRVLGLLGTRAIVRGNQINGFALGIRLVPLVTPGIGLPAQVSTFPLDAAYQTTIRPGPLYLVADNVIDGSSAAPPLGPWQSTRNPPSVQWIDARGPSMVVDNVAGDAAPVFNLRS